MNKYIYRGKIVQKGTPSGRQLLKDISDALDVLHKERGIRSDKIEIKASENYWNKVLHGIEITYESEDDCSNDVRDTLLNNCEYIEGILV